MRWIAGWVGFELVTFWIDYQILDGALDLARFWYVYLVYLPATTAMISVPILAWITRRGRARQCVELEVDGAWLPYSRFSRGRRWVPYEDVVSLGWFFPEPYARFHVGTDSLAQCSYKACWFEDTRALDRIDRLVREGVARLPDGRHRLARMDRRRAVSDEARRSGLRVTIVAALSLFGVFCFQWTSGALDDELVLLWQGPVVWWMREELGAFVLVSGAMLHASWWHFLINLVALGMLGLLVEPILGRWRFALVVLGGGLLASMSAQLYYDEPAVGCSAALCAALGAFVTINSMKREDLAVPYRASWRLGVVVLILTAGSSLMIGRVGDMAHAAGFFAGSLLAVPLMGSLDPLAPDRSVPSWIRAAAIGIGVIYLLAIAQWVHHLRTTDVIDMLRAASQHWDDPRFRRDLGTGLALGIGLDEHATPTDLELALDRARRGLVGLDEDSKLTQERVLEGIGFIEERLASARSVQGSASFEGPSAQRPAAE